MLRRLKRRVDLDALVLILSVAAVIAYGYFSRVEKPDYESRQARHSQIVAHTSPAPDRYRILVPVSSELMARILTRFPAQTAFLTTYTAFNLLAIFFFLALLFWWLRSWFARGPALIGTLFVAGTLPIALQSHRFQPWTLFEAVIFAGALLAIQRRRFALLVGLLIFATLNKETALFIPLAYLLTLTRADFRSAAGQRPWLPWLRTGGLFLIWAAITVGLRGLLGSVPHGEAIMAALARNLTLSSVTYTLLRGTLLLGGLWLFALCGFRAAPRFVRTVCWAIPVYLLIALARENWQDVTYLLPLSPVLVALGLSYLYEPKPETAEDGSPRAQPEPGKIPRFSERRRGIGALILILSVAIVIAYGYFSRVDKPNYAARQAMHSQIIAGTAPSPYRYRVLVPVACEAAVRALARYMPARTAFLLTYAAYDLLAIFALLALLFWWLRTWFAREPALIGVLFVAGTLPVALQSHYFQPWSLLEAGLFTGALLAIYRGRFALLAGLVALAALNRETAVFIPLVYLLTLQQPDFRWADGKVRWRPWLRVGGLFLIWAGIFIALHVVLGSAPHVESLNEILARNTSGAGLINAGLHIPLFLGGLWVYAILGFRLAPRYVKRAALICAPYLLTIIVWGSWREVRLLIPLYPVLIALGLFFLFPKDEEAAPSRMIA